jgi:hypothetical protein
MTKIGRRIFYDLLTGNIILDKGEMQGSVVQTTVDQDFFTFLELKQRDKATVGVKELNFGEFSQDFATCNGVRVDLTTKELLFTYPSEGESTVTPEKPLTTQVSELKSENSQLKQQLTQTNQDLADFMEFYTSTLG